MRWWTLVCTLASGVLVTACLAPPTSAERLGNAAYELNMATRFGRMDIAGANVAAEAQAEFLRRHRPWGRSIRVVDLELLGMQLASENEAEVELSVSWHRLDETEMRATTLVQRWANQKGGWKLIAEEPSGGAPNLLPPSRKPSKGAASEDGPSKDGAPNADASNADAQEPEKTTTRVEPGPSSAALREELTLPGE